jgi:hypothetical protein
MRCLDGGEIPPFQDGCMYRPVRATGLFLSGCDARHIVVLQSSRLIAEKKPRLRATAVTI